MNGRKSFPYPVLSNGDDITGDFKPQFAYSIDPDFVTIKCEFEVTNEYVNKMIAENKALYSVEIECGSTYYRQLVTTNKRELEHKIPSDWLRERVDIRFYICATTEIDAYYPTGTHADFGNEPFYLEEGDVLATGGTTSFIVAKEFDPLNAPISSIIKLEKSKKQIAEMRVTYDNERIIIELPKQDFELYSQIKSNSAEMLHATLVLPVLVDAIYEISGKGTNNYQDFAWSDRLKHICIDRQIDIDEPLSAAQKILNNPINRSLQWRNKEALLSEEDADE
jgi:hypothetical protein